MFMAVFVPPAGTYRFLEFVISQSLWAAPIVDEPRLSGKQEARSATNS